MIAAVSLGSSQGVLQEEDRVHPRVGKAVSHRRRLMKQTLSVQRGSRLTLRVLSIAEGRLGRAINRSWEPKAAWTATSSRLKAVSAMAPASQGGSARGGAFVADCGEDRGESGAGGEKETTTRSRLSQETRQAPATARWVNEA